MSEQHWVQADDDVVVVMSQGMEALGQPELVFAVRPSPQEDPAEVRAMLQGLLETLATHASEGQGFAPWGWSAFGEHGFLGLQGVVYVDPMGHFPEVPSGALLGLLLFGPELELIRRVGAYRVVTRMGAELRAYPFPLVSSAERPSVVEDDESAGLLEHIARPYFDGLTLTLVEGVVHVHALPEHAPLMSQVLEHLPDPPALALTGDVTPHADARLVWSPGDTGPAAISGPGSQGSVIAGGQLMVAVTSGEDAVQIVEDGFALVCEPETWAALRDAWIEAKPFALPPTSAGGLGLSVTFEQMTPVDEDFVRLLAPEPQFARATNVEALSAYVSALSLALDGVFGVDVTVELRPDASPEISWSRPLPDPVVKALYGAAAPEVAEVAPFLIHKAPASD